MHGSAKMLPAKTQKAMVPSPWLLDRLLLLCGASLLMVCLTIVVGRERPAGPALLGSDGLSAPLMQGGRPLEAPIVYGDGNKAMKRAQDILNRAAGDYHTSLLGLKADLDRMLAENLPKWVGNRGHPEVARALQERAAATHAPFHRCLQMNEEVLGWLLRLPPTAHDHPTTSSLRTSPPSPSSTTSAAPSHHGAFLRKLEEASPTTQASDSTGPLRQAASGKGVDGKQTSAPKNETKNAGYDEATQIFTHLLRDWSIEGATVREKTYGPVHDQARRFLPPGSRVLVPGAGLGRLAFELAADQGHKVTALDISIVMLQTTHSILSLPPSTTLSFYPHLTDPLQNQLSHRNKYVSATAPDRAPLLPPEYPQASLQLHYGDLITLADRPEEQGTYDGVVTCFFIDTAVHVFDYLQAIHRLLKPGGVWINHGPLQYHSGLPSGSVHLAHEDVLEAARLMNLTTVEPLAPVPPPVLYRPAVLGVETLADYHYRPMLHVARRNV